MGYYSPLSTQYRNNHDFYNRHESNHTFFVGDRVKIAYAGSRDPCHNMYGIVRKVPTFFSRLFGSDKKDECCVQLKHAVRIGHIFTDYITISRHCLVHITPADYKSFDYKNEYPLKPLVKTKTIILDGPVNIDNEKELSVIFSKERIPEVIKDLEL